MLLVVSKHILGKMTTKKQSNRKRSLFLPHLGCTLESNKVHFLADCSYLPFESESEVAQSCPTLCDPVDCSPPGSSVHGILQARILEWVAISFSRGSSWPRDQTQVSRIAGRHFNLWATFSGRQRKYHQCYQAKMLNEQGCRSSAEQDGQDLAGLWCSSQPMVSLSEGSFPSNSVYHLSGSITWGPKTQPQMKNSSFCNQ